MNSRFFSFICFIESQFLTFPEISFIFTPFFKKVRFSPVVIIFLFEGSTSKSLIFSQKADLEKRFLHENKDVPEFTVKRKLMLSIFALSFAVMIWGVSTQGWWFLEMTSLFFVVGIIICFLSGLGEKRAVSEFVTGASELVGVGLTIGVARAVNIIIDNGLISD